MTESLREEIQILSERLEEADYLKKQKIKVFEELSEKRVKRWINQKPQKS